MEFLNLVAAALVAWIVLSTVLGPVCNRWAARAPLGKRPVRNAVAAVVETASGIAFWFLVSATIAALIVAYSSFVSAANLGEAEAGLSRIRSLTDGVSKVNDALGLSVLCLVVIALLVWSYRRVKRVTHDELGARFQATVERLATEAAAGLLERIPSSPAMKKVEGEIDHRIGLLDELAANGAEQGRSHADIESELTNEIRELQALRLRLDLYRRAEVELAQEQEQTKAAPRAWWRRLATVFISDGMFDTTGFALRVVGILAMLATVPASISLFGPLTLDALEKKRYALEAQARDFRFALDSGEINQAFAAAQESEAGAPEVELDANDERVADELAKVFESQFASGQWLRTSARAGRAATARTDNVVRAATVRNGLLRRAAARGETLTAISPTQAQPMLAEAETLLTRSATSAEPVTSMGRRAAQENRRIAREQPELWAQLKQNYSEYRRSFGRVAPAHRVYSLAISQTLGDSLNGMVDGRSFFANQAQRFGAQVSSDAAEKFVDASYKKFVLESATSGDFRGAAASAGEIASRSLPRDQVAALDDMLAAMPEPSELDEAARRRRVVLATQQSGIDGAAAQRAVQRYAATFDGSAPIYAADALAAFADYFPGSVGQEQSTRRAEVARRVGLAGAPPAPGRETRRYRSTSRTMSARAGSYGSLRGFSRVGGVLIGRDGEGNEKLRVDHFGWSVRDGRFHYELGVDGLPARRFGPFDPAIANLALAYAADGRATAVTMVSAAPLAELKILLHPALVDTGLGCRARRLDQFADTVSTPNTPLAVAREAEHSAAIGEVALYGIARAAQIVALSRDDVVAANLESIRAGGLVEAARTALGRPRNADEAMARAAHSAPLVIASKDAYFDRELVGRMQACLPADGIESFAGCVGKSALSSLDTFRADEHFAWLAPVPEYQVWSGVREQPYTVDSSLDFLAHRPGDAMWPFRFMVQLAIQSPAYHADSPRPWFAEDNQAIDTYVDEAPWEFERAGELLGPAIATAVEANSEMAGVMRDMAQFALLQRLFRAALDGPLAAQFPTDALLEIADATAPSVNDDARTLRWNVRPGQVERRFYERLDAVADLPEAGRQCQAYIYDAARRGVGALGSLPEAEWEAACGAAVFAQTQPAWLGHMAEQVAASRALRASLNVAADEPLVERLAREGCPLP